MKKITASRISDGNKLFPASITIEDTGLKVRLPGFWKDEETFVSYTDISGVSVDTPLIGYSSIEFNVMGSRVKAHGFTKSEVKEIKQAIEDGKKRGPVISSSPTYINPTGANASGGDTTTVVNKAPGFGHFMGKALGDSISKSMSLSDKFDQQDREKAAKIEDLAQMKMSSDKDELLEQLNYLASLASSKPEKEIKNVIIEKMEFGIMKLKSSGANGEADFFEKKLEPLKKKGWF